MLAIVMRELGVEVGPRGLESLRQDPRLQAQALAILDWNRRHRKDSELVEAARRAMSVLLEKPH